MQEPGKSFVTSHGHIRSQTPVDEWEKSSMNGRTYVICKAYQEPGKNSSIENVILGRTYIID